MTTTYFENLKGALASANRLLKQEDQAQHTISQGAKTSLYYAHGATVKAEIELDKQVSRSEQANRLYTSVVRSKQNSDNLLTASKAAVTSAKGTNGKISKAAVKFQAAANALTQLSSHMASVMAITSASDQGSKMDELVNEAYERTKKAAQDAEQASLVSLDSTIEASQSIAGHVVQKAQTLNQVLRAMQTAINTQMEAINGQVTSNLQTHAEALDTENTNAGIFKSAHLETMATDNSRRYINEQTNYNLTLEDVGLPSDPIRKALRPDLEKLEEKHNQQKVKLEKDLENFVATLQTQQEKVEIALKRTGAEERVRTEQLLMLKEFQQQELSVQRKLLEALMARDLRNQVWQMHLAEHGANQDTVKKVKDDFKKAMKAAGNEPVAVPEAVCLFFGFKVDDKFTLKKLDGAVRNVSWNPLENYLNPYARYQRAKSALTVRNRHQHGDAPTKHEVDAEVKEFVRTAPDMATTVEFGRLVEEEWAMLVKRKESYIASLEALYQGNVAALQRKDEEVIHSLKEKITILRKDWLDLDEKQKEQLVNSQAESVVNSATAANQNALEQFKQTQASELEILEQNRANELELLSKRQKQELTTLKGSHTRELNALSDVQKGDAEDLQDEKTVFIPREELSQYLPGNLKPDQLSELQEAHQHETDAVKEGQKRAMQERKEQHQRQQVEVEERFNSRKAILIARQGQDFREKEAEVATLMEEVRQTKESEALRPFFKYIPPQHTLDLLHTLTIPGLGRSLTVTFQAYKNSPAGYRVVFVEESEVGSINWERITHLPPGHYMDIAEPELATEEGTPYRTFTRVYLTKEGKEELSVVRENNKVALAAFEQAVARLNQEPQEDLRHNFAIDLRQTASDYKGNPLQRGGTYQALIFGLDESRLKNPDTAASQISEPSAPMYLAQELATALPMDSFVASIAAPPLASTIHKSIRRANSQLHRLAPGTFRAQGQANQFFYLFLYKDLQGNLTMETLFNIPKLAKEREQLNPYLGGETESLSEYRIM
ncbi:MAG TPA: hypothetical protein DCR93_20030, partial [Cytophagales bacterium]|nr:hypothetical protein [Cytophagales bacterium]